MKPTDSIRVLLAHPGTQYARHLATELQARGCLHRFWTGLVLPEFGWIGSLLRLCPSILGKYFSNRIAIGLPGSRVRNLPLIELRARRALSSHDAEAVYFKRNNDFQEAIPDSEIQGADVVVGYDTSSWILARRAKDLGKCFILDQSIGHPAEKEKVFEGLRGRFPGWSTSVPKKDRVLLECEREEHDLADLIVVPSDFVKETLILEGVNAAKIRVIPFGTNLGLFHPPHETKAAEREKTVFLFVGGLTARKGVPVLLEAWRRLSLDHDELWLVGCGEIPAGERQTLPTTVKLLGQKSPAEVASLMRQADVFVFPSFYEGLAQVQVEAMASGLPVISTREAGASGLVKEGINGFIVPAGDADALAGRMRQLAADPSLRLQMRQAAVTCRDELSWRVYGQKWADMLNEWNAGAPPV